MKRKGARPAIGAGRATGVTNMARHECDCGQTYGTANEVLACQTNNHGNKRPMPKRERRLLAAAWAIQADLSGTLEKLPPTHVQFGPLDCMRNLLRRAIESYDKKEIDDAVDAFTSGVY